MSNLAILRLERALEWSIRNGVHVCLAFPWSKGGTAQLVHDDDAGDWTKIEIPAEFQDIIGPLIERIGEEIRGA